MRFHSFLIKYGEIGIKGKNRYLFEDALVRQMRFALKGVDGDFYVHKAQGRVYVECEGEYDYEETIESLKRVFGIVGICPVVRVEDRGFEQLSKDVISYMEEMYPDGNQTFKVEARRSRKQYPMTSMEINCELGGVILDAFPGMKVDVHNPDIRLNVEVREEIYLYSERQRHASAVRRDRQPGCRLYDLKAGRGAACHLFPCTAVYQREGEREGG